jgi:hypothetical protein
VVVAEGALVAFASLFPNVQAADASDSNAVKASRVSQPTSRRIAGHTMKEQQEVPPLPRLDSRPLFPDAKGGIIDLHVSKRSALPDSHRRPLLTMNVRRGSIHAGLRVAVRVCACRL